MVSVIKIKYQDDCSSYLCDDKIAYNLKQLKKSLKQ